MNASLVYETGVAQRKHESEVCGLVFAITKTPVWGGQTRFAKELRQSGGVRLVLPLLHFTVRPQCVSQSQSIDRPLGRDRKVGRKSRPNRLFRNGQGRKASEKPSPCAEGRAQDAQTVVSCPPTQPGRAGTNGFTDNRVPPDDLAAGGRLTLNT